MKINYDKKGWRVILILFIGTILSIKLSDSCRAAEIKKAQPPVHGVTIVSLDTPLRSTIGRKVNIEVVVGNERASNVTTILTIAETLNGLSSQKITYSWNTNGLKEGTYVIRAELEKVPEETNLDDNVRQIEILLQR